MKPSTLLKARPTAEAPRATGTAILAVAACAVLWSTGGLFVKLIAWNPFAIAAVRSLVGGVVILAFVRTPRFTWSFAQIAGAVCYAACMVGFVSANKLTTAANAILLQYTAPIWAAIMGWVFLRERVHVLDWAAMAVVVGGMVLFFVDSLSLGGMQGNVLAILSGVAFAGAMVAFRAQKDGSSRESILLAHAITFVVGLPFLFGPWPSLAGLGALGFLGVFQIGLSSVLLTYGVKHVTAVQSLLTAVIEPLFNPIWVFLVIGERPGPRALVGGAIILVAVTVRSLLSLRSGARARAGQPAAG